MADYAHLHVHSDYSLLDGLGRIPLMVAEAKRQEMPALALTDHGVLFGAVEFVQCAQDAGVKPIVGLEAYVTDGSHRQRTGSIYHLTLLAENERGYRNLMQLTSKGHLDGFYRKPRVDHELLARHSEGVICLSGCANGEIPRALQDGNAGRAEELADWYRAVYADRFYLELQDHGLDFQKGINEGVLALHKRLGIPVVATNDVHYVLPEHARIHDVLLCVQTQTTLNDPKRMRMDSQQFYLKPVGEMEGLFGHVSGALANSLVIAERCNLSLSFDRPQLPRPPLPGDVSSRDHLRALCADGIRARYGADADEAVHRRLNYELDIIERTGYVDYFLLVHDFIRFARERGIAIGVRGSVGGSLVAYALKITGIDPLANGLSFERFLNPERVSMPDVDIDIADDRREELIRYVTDMFGRDRVAQIITFGTMAARAAVRDVGRALGISLAHVDQVAKLIPFNAGLDDALTDVAELKGIYDADPIMKNLIDTAREMEGVARHASTHAAGIVICAEPLVEHVPLYKVPKNDVVTTQYAMGPLEKLGLLKMDFLGLRTLTVLARAAALVEQDTGEPCDVESLPLDDPEMFAMLGRGETFGIFQVDGAGMRRLLRQMQPNCFEDIVALIALYRPGPMQFIEEFVRRRAGAAPVAYPHPALGGVLADTYGIPVYQEQIVRMVVDIAGFSPGKADIVRKAMGKKQPELMAKYRADFVAGAVTKGTPADQAQQLFDIIQEFSGYGFNKAHSAAYAVVTCHTAYLKAHYPVPYMAAFLSAERENAEKVAEALGECRRLKIPVLGPDVNASAVDFSLESGSIRYGLGAIRNVGEAAAAAIVAEREENGPYRSLADLCRRLDWHTVNKRTLESLIKAGALDSLGERGQLIVNLDRIVAFGARSAREAASGQVSLFGEAAQEHTELQLQPCAPAELPQRLAWEKENLGAYVSEHPLDRAAPRLAQLGARPLGEVDQSLEGQPITVGGVISSLRTFTTRKGEPMASVQLTDLDGAVDIVVYPRVYSRSQDVITQDAIIVVAGTVIMDRDRVQLRADSVMSLEAAEEQEPAGPSGASVSEPPPPIPFRRRASESGPSVGRTAPTPAHPQGRLVIDFVRGTDRAADLQRIQSIYEILLRYPGRDRVVMRVHHGQRVRLLPLPIDNVDMRGGLQTELGRVAPGLAIHEEQLGA